MGLSDTFKISGWSHHRPSMSGKMDSNLIAEGPNFHRLGLIITPEMLLSDDGNNINGPSLIRVPDWVANPLGKYYLYFAHHDGKFIRLAYADCIAGPYRIFRPGSLRLEQCTSCRNHIASPDVHVDNANKEIVMYFHGPSRDQPQQLSFRAVSGDGLSFAPDDKPLGRFYFRVWSYGDCTYALAKDWLYRSYDGGRSFLPGHRINDLNRRVSRRIIRRWKTEIVHGAIRHTAVRVVGDILEVYFTRYGDAPERIYRAEIDLKEDWTIWTIKDEKCILWPQETWEGASLPLTRSRNGVALKPENALRDPAIYCENGKTYLLYAVKGESGIAIGVLN